jgi:hypothetical protein
MMAQLKSNTCSNHFFDFGRLLHFQNFTRKFAQPSGIHGRDNLPHARVCARLTESDVKPSPSSTAAEAGSAAISPQTVIGFPEDSSSVRICFRHRSIAG